MNNTENAVDNPPPCPDMQPGSAALEGELRTELHTGFQVFYLDDCELSEVLAFALKVRRNERRERDFGRVRITIEPLRE
jgi:hypothetical protein